MPIAGYNFTPQEITVRFRAPYISQSLNQQYRGAVSTGVYEGFNPTNSVAAFELVLLAGPAGRSTAIATSPTDLSTNISVHLDGDLTLDLTAFANKLVAVAIDLIYSFPGDTTGKINVYDLGSETVPPESCVLVEVQVPAAGPIPLANITAKGRSFPWVSRGRDATPMVSVVRNGGPFLTRDFVGLPDFWDQSALVDLTFAASNAVTAPSGFNLTFRASKNAAGAGAVTGVLSQKVGLPIPANRRVRISGDYRALVAPSVGAPALEVVVTDKDGVGLTTETLPLTPPAIGVWTSFSTTVLLPALTSVAAVVKEVRASLTAVTYTTGAPNTPVFDLANIDVQLEQVTAATDTLPEISGETHHTKVRLYEDAFPGAEYADLTYGSGETVLSSSVPGAGHTFRVEGNEIVEQDLTVLDTLLVNTALNPLSAKLNVVGGFTQSGGEISLDADVLPISMRTSSGDISIGSKTTGYVEVFTDTGPITIQSYSGPAFMLGAAGAVLWSGSALPITFSGDVMIGSELGVGGVSIFAGGQPPNAPVNALLISALTTVNVGSATLPAAVVEAINIDVAASTGDALLRSASGGVVIAAGTPPAPIANDIRIRATAGGGDIEVRSLFGGVTLTADNGDILVTAGTGDAFLGAIVGNASVGTISGGGLILFAGGPAPALPPASSILMVGKAGVVIFAGDAAPPAPTNDVLRMRAESSVEIISDASDVSISTTAGDVSITSAGTTTITGPGTVSIGGTSFAVVISPTVGATATVQLCNSNPAVGNQVEVVHARGALKVVRKNVAGNFATAIEMPGAYILKPAALLVSGSRQAWPVKRILQGIYRLKIHHMYQRNANDGLITITFAVSAGLFTANLMSFFNPNALQVQTFNGVMSGFMSGDNVTAGTPAGLASREGIIQFTADCDLQLTSTWSAAGDVDTFQSFAELIAIDLT